MVSANGPKVLVIEDEPQIRRLLQVALKGNGYKSVEAGNGRDGLTMCAMERPDVVILDLGLPDIDGQEVIRSLREWTAVPILILSVREYEKEKVAALDAGADDFVTKPFGMSELLARLRVLLRRNINPETKPVVSLFDLTIDRSTHRVMRDHIEIKLTPTEFTLLAALANHPGRVLTHSQLLKEVWGPGFENQTQYLRVYIKQLRQKIEPDPAHPKYLLTESGIGYRTCEPALSKETGSSSC